MKPSPSTSASAQRADDVARWLEDTPSADLEAELERRKKAPAAQPQPLSSPDWRFLRTTVITGVNLMVKNGYEDENLKGYIAEAAREAVYGKKYWEWRKSLGFYDTPITKSEAEEFQFNAKLQHVVMSLNDEPFVPGLPSDGTTFDQWCRHVGIKPASAVGSLAYAAWDAARDYFMPSSRRLGGSDR